MPIPSYKKESSVCQNSFDPKLRLLENGIGQARHARRGDPICLPMDSEESVYYVKTGCVKLVRHSSSGDAVVIDQYHARSLFGNLRFSDSSLCCGSDHEVAVAVEDSEVLVTTFESLKRNMDRYPEALVSLLEDYCRRLAAARLRIESLVLHEAEERLARALLIMAAYQQPGQNGSVLLNTAVTHEELASLIGVTRPFVTRLVGQLRDCGLIETVSVGQLLVHQDKIKKAYA